MRAADQELSKSRGTPGPREVTPGLMSWTPVASLDASGHTPDAHAPSPAPGVAEQVSYWISRDVRNAEIKLEGFDGNSVEVSISLQGRQAMVEFRTGHPEIRMMLEDSAPQLKDLLERQGLELSGVSVGTSGPGNQPSQEQEDRSPVRALPVVAAAAVSSGDAGTHRRNTGSTVDLYV